MEKVTGKTAPVEYIEDIRDLIRKHDTQILQINRLIAYHSGSKYNIEVDIVIPLELTVEITRDIVIGLQTMLEELSDVERAHVHVCRVLL